MKLDGSAARERFTRQRVARLATVGEAAGENLQPHVVPVTFAVDGDRILTAVDAKPKGSKDLKRLRNIRAHPRVSLLADHYAEDWDALWWVRADGVATVLEDEAAIDPPVRLLARKYEQYARQPPRGPVIDVEVHRWVGWTASS